MFVTMILDPIWKLYEAAFIDKNETKVGRMATKLGLDVPARELGSSDPRTVLQVCLSGGSSERLFPLGGRALGVQRSLNLFVALPRKH